MFGTRSIDSRHIGYKAGGYSANNIATFGPHIQPFSMDRYKVYPVFLLYQYS